MLIFQAGINEIYFSRSGDRYLINIEWIWSNLLWRTEFWGFIKLSNRAPWDHYSNVSILMLILSPFWKVLPKEMFEPDSERVLCQPVHAEPVLLPRLWRILPTDSNSYCWETQGTAHRGLSSKPKGFCPIFSGARIKGGGGQCWTKSSPPLALSSSLLSWHQPPLLGE